MGTLIKNGINYSSNNSEIDDTSVATNTTWSSDKIDGEIKATGKMLENYPTTSEVRNTYETKANVSEAVQTLQASLSTKASVDDTVATTDKTWSSAMIDKAVNDGIYEEITPNQDFNTKIDKKRYVVPNNSVMLTLLNRPCGLAGSLYVKFPLNPDARTLSGAWEYAVQSFETYTGEVWERALETNESGYITYGEWEQKNGGAVIMEYGDSEEFEEWKKSAKVGESFYVTDDNEGGGFNIKKLVIEDLEPDEDGYIDIGLGQSDSILILKGEVEIANFPTHVSMVLYTPYDKKAAIYTDVDGSLINITNDPGMYEAYVLTTYYIEL